MGCENAIIRWTFQFQPTSKKLSRFKMVDGVAYIRISLSLSVLPGTVPCSDVAVAGHFADDFAMTIDHLKKRDDKQEEDKEWML